MKEIISAVYKIVNEVTGDFYVGSSRNVYSRWAAHKYPSTWKQHPNSLMYQDMQKYGVENFRFQILVPVMPEYLKQVEQEYIEMLKEKGKQSIVLPLAASESQIAVQSTQFQYNKDYFVGDYVTVEHRRFGLRQNKIQLIGMIESFDRNGRNLTPTFREV